MPSKSKKFDTDLINTIVGEETDIKGTIQSQGSIRVEGSIEGDVVSHGEVYIGEKSIIKANVYGTRVVVAGEVTGNVEATKGIKICATGKVYGDISGDRLVVEEGGIYKGKVNMDVISSRNLYEGKFELVQAK